MKRNETAPDWARSSVCIAKAKKLSDFREAYFAYVEFLKDVSSRAEETTATR